jgi:hypothetical protein
MTTLLGTEDISLPQFAIACTVGWYFESLSSQMPSFSHRLCFAEQ